MATTAPAMVLAILALRPSLHPIPDELRKRVQSIRVRSAQETRNSTDGNAWRQKPPVSHSVSREPSNGQNNWRGLPTSTPKSPPSFRFAGNQSSTVTPIHRIPSFQTPSAQPITPSRYVSRFHNGSKTGDDQILNTVILNKLNVFSVKTYDDVKQFLLQILGSDQKEFIREFTWLVFRKAAAEDKFCGLFAKLLSEIQKEYPVILEEMRNLHTTYLDIWDVSDKTTNVDRRCRLGYSQFLAELTALGVLESDTMKVTLERLKYCIADCLPTESRKETVEEYMDCLGQLCGTKVPKGVRMMIREILVNF